MIWIISLFVLIFSGCQQQPQEHRYTEIAIDSPTPSVSNPHEDMDQSDPHAGLDMSAGSIASGMPSSNNMFSWVTPEGWKQKPGQGLRMASFYLNSDEKAIDCSIVSLGPMAGGLEANLRRWMGQIGIQASDETLADFMNKAVVFKVKGGQEAKIFDFSSFQDKAKSSDKSMVAAMISFDQATLFVKVTGSIEAIKKNKDSFFKLVKSVEANASPDNTSTPSMINPDSSNDPHAGMDMSSMGGMLGSAESTSPSILTWSTPQGWKEEASNHMRLATFRPQNDPKAIDCSIIILGGAAGGVSSNLERWMGQIGLQPSNDNLKKLTDSAQMIKTMGNIETKVFDLTTLQNKANSSDKSMIVTMIPVDSGIVFVKMTGSIGSVKQNKDNFLKLVRSITHK